MRNATGRFRGRCLAGSMAMVIAVAGCQPAEMGTVGVPRPVDADGNPLPTRSKGGPEAPAKPKAKSRSAGKAESPGR